jgi:hypothetical protein
MLKDTQPHKTGKLFLVALGLLALSACRDSVPPKIEVCIGDGFGGADCVEADGSKLYKSPSALENYWMTSQPDEANFASWCYDTTPAVAKIGMEKIKSKIRN